MTRAAVVKADAARCRVFGEYETRSAPRQMNNQESHYGVIIGDVRCVNEDIPCQNHGFIEQRGSEANNLDGVISHTSKDVASLQINMSERCCILE